MSEPDGNEATDASSPQVEFPPIANGFDYVQSAIGHLLGKPTSRDLKYAILHLQSAVEVLLKSRLIREHWSLVFADPAKARRASFESGDFVTADLDATVERLRELAGIHLDPKDLRSINSLRRLRNKLQHFGLQENVAAVRANAGRVLDFLLQFMRTHLLPGSTASEESALNAALEAIQEEMHNIEVLIEQRMRRLSGKLAERGKVIVVCPACGQFALSVDEGNFCFFCERSWLAGNAADEYAGAVLSISWHDVLDGASNPVRTCPNCDDEAFVNSVTIRGMDGETFSVCFSCSEVVKDSAVDDCVRCGEPMLVTEDDSSTVCDRCWKDAMAGD